MTQQSGREPPEMVTLREIIDALPTARRDYVERRARDLIAEVAEHKAGWGAINLFEALSDPVAVHINMLRGTIAKPSIESIIHLYGADNLRAALAKATAA